jgi:hypothetical protein
MGFGRDVVDVFTAIDVDITRMWCSGSYEYICLRGHGNENGLCGERE